MGDVGAGVEYQKTVRITADDGEYGGGDTVEVVVLPRRAAYAVVLNIQEEICVIGKTADVLGSMARGSNGDGIGSPQSTGYVD